MNSKNGVRLQKYTWLRKKIQYLNHGISVAWDQCDENDSTALNNHQVLSSGVYNSRYLVIKLAEIKSPICPMMAQY